MSGGEKYMLTAAKCLAEDHSVSLFWNTEKEASIRQEALRKFALDLGNIAFKPNIFAKEISFWSRFKESSRYDVIIYLSDGSLPLLACKLFVHFQAPVEWVSGSSIKTKIKLLKTQRIICNSQFTKQYIDRKFRVQSNVLYPPVIVKETSSAIKKENVILHVGRFGVQTAGSSYKKQEVMADVFKKMVDDGLKDWELVFVVSVSDQHMSQLVALQKEVEKYPIQFIINAKDVELWEWYAKARIYWHASGYGEDLQQHPDRAEHFGISTVEAMSKGAVPIVIRAGGQTEIITDGEDGLLWETKEELMQKTKNVIDNETLRQTLANNASKRAKDFDQEKFCRELQSLIS